MKRTASARKKLRSNGSSHKKGNGAQYVVCISNKDYPVSLETRKIYSLIPDLAAAKSGLLRVIDESGEDYLYPTEYFVPIKLPRTVQRAVEFAS